MPVIEEVLETEVGEAYFQYARQKTPEAPLILTPHGRAHPATTPSAWDDTEKQNPAAPAVRDDALLYPYLSQCCSWPWVTSASTSAITLP